MHIKDNSVDRWQGRTNFDPKMKSSISNLFPSSKRNLSPQEEALPSMYIGVTKDMQKRYLHTLFLPQFPTDENQKHLHITGGTSNSWPFHTHFQKQASILSTHSQPYWEIKITGKGASLAGIDPAWGNENKA